jgi:uncharacterized paraquat-inducible protein A
MASETNPGTRSFTCPLCASGLEYPTVNVAKAFKCPSCGNALMVSEQYTKMWRTSCYVLTLIICVLLARRNLFFLFFAPAVLFLVSAIASIVTKRIFPPLIEPVVDRSNEARYTAL